MAESLVRPRIAPDRVLILASLLSLAAAAWGVLIWQSAVMDDDMSLTMGMSAPLFIALWVVMMVAIMYPTAAPMIMAFARIHQDRRSRGDAFVPTWVFAGSYLLLWSATGVFAYVLAVAGDELANESGWVMDNAARLGGALLIAGGLYQLTPIKNVCLNKCRTPMSFLLNSWREGTGGAFRMGLEHGAYCLGCCWLLFLILFPLGMMNIAVLALIALLIFAEKVAPLGPKVATAAAIGLVVYGAFVVFTPSALPMAMGDDSMAPMTDEHQPENSGTMNDDMAPIMGDQ